MYLSNLMIEELDEVELAPGFVAQVAWVQIHIDVDEDTHEITEMSLGRNGQKGDLVVTDAGPHKSLFLALKAAIEREYHGSIIEHVREAKRGRREADRDQASAERREYDGRLFGAGL